jgi:hypothetical protein
VQFRERPVHGRISDCNRRNYSRAQHRRAERRELPRDEPQCLAEDHEVDCEPGDAEVVDLIGKRVHEEAVRSLPRQVGRQSADRHTVRTVQVCAPDDADVGEQPEDRAGNAGDDDDLGRHAPTPCAGRGSAAARYRCSFAS